MSRTKMAPMDVALWSGVVVLLAAIIYWSIVAPPSTPGFAFPGSDKLLHALAYGALTWLLLLAGVWRPGRRTGLPLSAWVVVLWAISLGILLEFAQAFVHRDPDPFDGGAEVLGTLVACAAWWILRAAKQGEPLRTRR